MREEKGAQHWHFKIMHEGGTAGTKGNPSVIPSATPYRKNVSRGKDIPRMQNLCIICKIHIHTFMHGRTDFYIYINCASRYETKVK